MLVLADPDTHCTSPTMAPYQVDIVQAIAYLREIGRESGAFQQVAFTVSSNPPAGSFKVPAYITRRGLSAVPDLRSRGTIKFEIINPITTEYTNWLSIEAAVGKIVDECILMAKHTEPTTAGWRLVGSTRSVKVSIVNPHQVGFNNSTSGAGNSSSMS